jgi:hypothetical protein
MKKIRNSAPYVRHEVQGRVLSIDIRDLRLKSIIIFFLI